MSDPVQVADDLWKRLIAHQPAVAAALALQLRDLPDDWPQRLLGITRPHAALELPATSGMPMEIQPYDTSDWESCLACAEFRQLCRYHEGFAAGYEALDGPLTDASRLDPTVTVKEMFQRLMDAEEAAESVELAAAVEQLTGGQG
ncbi:MULTISPECIES: hypothetical protein [Streptomyces]|uniref:hypothetical protein n=1 Tax=Streptomyces TaxID=1883 RepID=UPI002065C9BA|nr:MULTISPECIES: hypothetical protein [Streptomyces]UPT46766.1 hypothetical protein MWG59_38600 [Streptomyces sp. WAC00303]WIY80883.1 hypothetical protein QPM16_38230 [Streptomyces anulatus]